MRTFAVIFTDVAGYPNRRDQIRRIAAEFGGTFLAISPAEIELGIRKVAIPGKWEDKRKSKLKNGKDRTVYRTAQAVSEIGVTADFYVHLEGDVHGDDAAWRCLFKSILAAPPFDLACAFPMKSRAGRWQCFIGITILSARAMQWVIQDAPATASVHNERAVPETVAKHGGRITGLRAVCRKAISRRSLRFVVEGRDAPRPMLRPGILSHPCKWDVEP
jgi:hypothetical protein